MEKSSFEVTIFPTGQKVTIDGSKALGPALKALGFRIQSGCAGYGYCADCIVTVLDGIENVQPPTYDERRMIGALFHQPKYREAKPTRLACQVRVSGPITVDLTKHLEAPEEEVPPSRPQVIVPVSNLVRAKARVGAV